jgi:HSP20 family molecular chaperone IbpA
MAFRHPFFEYDPFEDLLFNAFKAEPDARAITGRQDSMIFPRYRAVSDHNAMILEIELPGVDKKSIELDVNRKQLTVAAKRPILSSFGAHRDNGPKKAAIEGGEHKGGERMHEVEGSVEKAVAEVRTQDNSLKYSAKFRLGYDVDVDHVSADFKEGILCIRVPRHEESTSRRVEVSMQS